MDEHPGGPSTGVGERVDADHLSAGDNGGGVTAHGDHGLAGGGEGSDELRDALPGISPHTLTSRLRQFERYGLVTRTAYPEIPPRVEYRLTELGKGLRKVLDAMAEWAGTIPG